MSLQSSLDHLVVAAATLQQGVAWCRDTLGIDPGPGGQHRLMGTHNRLLRIAAPEFPRAYLEIIAIDPAAPAPGRTRWFDLDMDSLQQTLVEQGPRLVHFVARTNNGADAVAALASLGIARGPLITAQRATPAGLLRWRISVRGDGQRLFDGALPTLIEWGEAHPCDSMPDRGPGLRSLRVSHPQAQRLRAAYAAIGLSGIEVLSGPPDLIATLSTPAGEFELKSGGL